MHHSVLRHQPPPSQTQPRSRRPICPHQLRLPLRAQRRRRTSRRCGVASLRGRKAKTAASSTSGRPRPRPQGHRRLLRHRSPTSRDRRRAVTVDEPRQQRITAFGGVAYGAADASVYQHGKPGHSLLLSDWPGEAADPHDPAYADLRTWLRSPEPLAARWLHALTPAQRTSAVLTAVACSRADGRRVVRPIWSSQPPPRHSRPTVSVTSIGVTVVINDADQLSLSTLTWVFSNALLFSAQGPLRLLLLAASLDGWTSVRAVLADRAVWTDARTAGGLA